MSVVEQEGPHGEMQLYLRHEATAGDRNERYTLVTLSAKHGSSIVLLTESVRETSSLPNSVPTETHERFSIECDLLQELIKQHGNKEP